MKKPLLLVLFILLVDQVLKIWIKMNFTLGHEYNLLGDWCRLHFIENEGMAFGMAFGGDVGKILLTVFRVVLSVFVFLYLTNIIKRKEKKLVVYSFTLIFAGAVGNVIDSLFYGLVFSESTYFSVAEFLPAGGGYASFGLGKVVDMFYFPLIDTVLPQSWPILGGMHIEFFNAIFNVSDAAITIGLFMLIFSLFINKDSVSDKNKSEKEIITDKTCL